MGKCNVNVRVLQYFKGLARILDHYRGVEHGSFAADTAAISGAIQELNLLEELGEGGLEVGKRPSTAEPAAEELQSSAEPTP